jgi:serine/threonine-protein kinase
MGATIDGRSDLYSAAIVLYEMLAGRPPFGGRGKSEVEARHDQLTARPPPVRSFFPHLPAALDAFFEQALQKDAGSRFSTAIAMGTAARAAFGLTDNEAWRAQSEMLATAPDTARMGTLREIIVERYRSEG